MKKPELLGLTGIRFYAALLVYLSHVVIIPGMEALSQSLLLFNAGVVGVSFFFVLSGFILTYNYAAVFSEGVSASSYKQFVLDRLARIYPVHIFALLMVAPIAILSPNFPFDWRAVPFHLLLLQSWWPSSTPPFYKYLNVPSWSISCEWFFYILAPMAIYFAFGNLRRWGMVGITVGYMSGLAWILWAVAKIPCVSILSLGSPLPGLQSLWWVSFWLDYFWASGQTGLPNGRVGCKWLVFSL